MSARMITLKHFLDTKIPPQERSIKMKIIKREFLAWLAIFLLALPALAADTNELTLIPLPQKIQRSEGVCQLTPRMKIYTDWGSRKTGRFLAASLRKSTGYSFSVHWRFFTGSPVKNGILLTTKAANAGHGAESYKLAVTTNAIVIRAPTQAGLFYGTRTLLQLLPPEIFSTNLVTGVNWEVPCVQIEDWPRFKWRGLMLDVSRHFYTKSDVEHILDLMALYKLNTFHWHLTDDQGWRIQIKKYPRLTQIGAWRKQSRIEPLPRKGANAHPQWMKPAADKFGPDGRYGGFYTPKDIHEVVAYAAARHITIVPEIEMPGHSLAALKAYPQLGCHDVVSPHNNIYCPANPETFKFLETVLSEVFQLFPGKYVHIGGDEVRKDYWKNSPECRALMKRKGLKNADELQSWFIKRIEKVVNAHGKTLIGWSEILQGGLASNAVVMDWIGGSKEAASSGHDVVMTPTGYCYLDHYQSTNHVTEPQAIGGYLPLQKVYSFEPIPKGLAPQYDSHILGAQANLWTEFVASLPHAEYMIFPRLCALSEVVWSSKQARNWPDFQRRLEENERDLNELGVNYRHSAAQVSESKSLK